MPTHKRVDGEASATASVSRRPSMLRLALQPGIARAALKVSLVVGTLLNVINNGGQLWAGHGVNIWRFDRDSKR